MRLTVVASSALSLISIVQAFDHFPFPCHQTYQVAKGDTCQSIAFAYGTTPADLINGNADFASALDCSAIKAGQLICVDYSTVIEKRSVANKAPHHGGKKHHGKKPHGKKPHGKKTTAAHKEAAKHHGKPAHPMAKIASHPNEDIVKKAPHHGNETAHHTKKTPVPATLAKHALHAPAMLRIKKPLHPKKVGKHTKKTGKHTKTSGKHTKKTHTPKAATA